MLSLQILERLVEFDTTSANSNSELLDWVESYLAGHGVPVTLLPADDGKANLVAWIGPETPGGIVLCGHTDVVPVDDRWTRDPFRITREGERLYGRGTTDMKGFIACALAAVPALTAAPLAKPVTLALTHDEEVGCLGAPSLATHLASEHPSPSVVIVGEPTELAAVPAHKGIRVLRTTVTGRAAHSSRPHEGASAVTAAARLVTFIDELATELATDGLRVTGFEPPHTTMNVGTISGGTALNIIPASCEIVWEYRWVPGEAVDDITRRVVDFAETSVVGWLRTTAPEATVTTQIVADVPALDPDLNADATAFALMLGAVTEGSSVAFATDGATLQQAGLPTVVCGPGSMAQGHQPDEYIEEHQLRRCDDLMTGVVRWAASHATVRS